MSIYKKNTATNVMVFATDVNCQSNGVTGLTINVNLSQDLGGFTVVGTATEVESGWYSYSFVDSNMNADDITWTFTNGSMEVFRDTFQTEAVNLDDLNTGQSSLMSGINSLMLVQLDLVTGQSSILVGVGNVQTDTTALITGQSSLISGVDSIMLVQLDLITGQSSIITGISSIDTGVTTLLSDHTGLVTGQNSILIGVNSVQVTADSLVIGVSSIDTGINSLFADHVGLVTGQNSILIGVNSIQASTDTASILAGVTELLSGQTSLSSEHTAISSQIIGITPVTVSVGEDLDIVMPLQSYPRIEVNDVFQFTRNVGPVPVNSVHVSIYDVNNTIVTSLVTATQSGNSANWYYFYPNPGSWYTTVESSGIHIIEWVINRSTGTDKEKDYFEVVKTDEDL